MTTVELDPSAPFTLDNIHTFLAPLDVSAAAGVEARARVRALLKLAPQITHACFQSLVKAPAVALPESSDTAAVKLYRSGLARNGLGHIFRHHADDTHSTNWAIPEQLREFIGGDEGEFDTLLARIVREILGGQEPITGRTVVLTAEEFDRLNQLIVDDGIKLIATPQKPRAVRTVWEVGTLYSRARVEAAR